MVRVPTSRADVVILPQDAGITTRHTLMPTVSFELSTIPDYILIVYVNINILIKANNFSKPINLINYFIL